MNAIRQQRARSPRDGARWDLESGEPSEEALLELAAFKGKYQKCYPEAVRSLMEDEEHLLTFYAFPQVMHRSLRTTNAIESFFEPRPTAHRSD